MLALSSLARAAALAVLLASALPALDRSAAAEPRGEVLTCCSPSAGIDAQNEFTVYPERNGTSATYVTRVLGGSGQVEVLAEYRGDLFAGIGDGGAQSTVTGVFAWLADENSSTGEQYDVVIRAGAPGGGPDPTPAGVVLRMGPFGTPVINPPQRSTHVARHTFAAMPLPRTGSLYAGVDLYPVNGWSTDGHSVWVSYHVPPAARPFGDNPRPGAPTLTWTVANGTAQPSSIPMTSRVGLLLPTPVLHVGGMDPNNTRQSPNGSTCFGAGGMFPFVSAPPGRNDGVELRIEDRARAGGNAFGLLGIGISPFGPIPIAGIAGNVWLDPVLWFGLGGSVIGSTGVAIVSVLPPGSIPVSILGVPVMFQGVTIAGGSAAFTNLAGVLY